MNEGKPAYTYNWFGLDQYTIEGPEVLDGEKANIKLTFDYDGNGTGKGGVAKLFVDGEMVIRQDIAGVSWDTVNEVELIPAVVGGC